MRGRTLAPPIGGGGADGLACRPPISPKFGGGAWSVAGSLRQLGIGSGLIAIVAICGDAIGTNGCAGAAIVGAIAAGPRLRGGADGGPPPRERWIGAPLSVSPRGGTGCGSGGGGSS